MSSKTIKGKDRILSVKIESTQEKAWCFWMNWPSSSWTITLTLWKEATQQRLSETEKTYVILAFCIAGRILRYKNRNDTSTLFWKKWEFLACCLLISLGKVVFKCVLSFFTAPLLCPHFFNILGFSISVRHQGSHHQQSCQGRTSGQPPTCLLLPATAWRGC